MTSPDPLAGATVPDPVPVAVDEPPWQRLDARMLAVVPVKQLGALAPLIVVLVVGGRGDGAWQLFGALAPVAVVLAVGLVRWLTVRYRIGPERVELRSGLVRRTERSVRRDRIRTVDLRATLVHRWFRLVAVEIGTGTAGKDGGLSLDGVTADEGERLRRGLLDRSPAAAPSTLVKSRRPASGKLTVDGPGPATAGEAGDSATGEPAGEEVARLEPGWLRYAPLTASGLVAVGATVGAVFKIAGDTGVDLADTETLTSADAVLRGLPTWLVVLGVVATVLVVASVGSLAVYAEGWWHYRLSREPDGTLRLSRGLLTTRSLSIEQRRMRGAEISEPLLLRLAGGGRCAAVTTGLDRKTSGHGALLPPAPVDEAHRVAAAALRLSDPRQGSAAPLVRHPLAALRRRLTRAVLPALVLAGLGWWLGGEVTELAGYQRWALLLPPLAALLAADRYRNLGHALTHEFLVIGRGSLVRRRVALQRAGIIGWRLRQSPFQRWAGVLTLDAVTPGGAGRYAIVDITPARALELVERTHPGLLPVEW